MSGDGEGPLAGPVTLERRHKTGGFSCGKPELDEYLKRYALTNQRKGGGRTYVALRDRRVVAYYTLAASSVLGGAMLKDSLRRALGAAEVIGARAVLTHAKDADARRFYERFDFVASPKNALHLFILMETIRESLGE